MVNFREWIDMSGALQAVFQNQRGFSTTPTIGSAYGGGYFAGQISTAGNGIADFNLVVGPVASAQSNKAIKTVATSTAGTSSLIDGPTNSSNMNNILHPAGQFCEGLTIGGFSDWYMPAKNELEVCYYNLKPSTKNNNNSYGINANAVPARPGKYTASIPPQTTSADFKTTGTEDFFVDNYWSSTEFSASSGWLTYFGDGDENVSGVPKTSSYYVRAVRRVAV